MSSTIDTKRFVGLADQQGLCTLCEFSDSAKELCYNQSLITEDACYFELPMTGSQVDILKTISGSDPAAGLKACLVFGKDNIEVPEDQEELWLSLSEKTLNNQN